MPDCLGFIYIEYNRTVFLITHDNEFKCFRSVFATTVCLIAASTFFPLSLSNSMNQNKVNAASLSLHKSPLVLSPPVPYDFPLTPSICFSLSATN